MNFRVGDIVEVQLVFVAVHVREEKFRMLITLRAITLLDNGHCNVSNFTDHGDREKLTCIICIGGSPGTTR